MSKSPSKASTIVTKVVLVGAVFGLGFGLAELAGNSPKQTDVDVNGLCFLSTDTCASGDIKVTMADDVARAMLPTQVSLEWPNTDAEQILVSLKGVEMDMGEPRFALQRTSGNTFTGELLLPVCTHDTMTWVATLSDGHHSHNFAVNMER